MTQWIAGWKKKNWMTASKKPVINREEFEALEQEINEDRNFELKWTHVKGHSGLEGNENADQLARRGASKYSG